MTTPKERKLKFLKDLCNVYGCDTQITRQQIIDVWSKNPDQYTHHLPMEKELRVDRGVYKTPKTFTGREGVVSKINTQKAEPKQRTVKDVIDILSVDSYEDTYYTDQDDIQEIVRML